EADEMRLELERRTAVHAKRLERAATPDEALVVRVHRGRTGLDETAAGDGEREQRHRASAPSSGRALIHDSSISASGSESQMMPPPTQRWIVPSAIAKVRIVSARSRSPFGRSVPSAPIDAPRPTGSSAAM